MSLLKAYEAKNIRNGQIAKSARSSFETIIKKLSDHIRQEADRGLPQTSYKLPQFMPELECQRLIKYLKAHGYNVTVRSFAGETCEGIFFGPKTYINIFWE